MKTMIFALIAMLSTLSYGAECVGRAKILDGANSIQEVELRVKCRKETSHCLCMSLKDVDLQHNDGFSVDCGGMFRAKITPVFNVNNILEYSCRKEAI